MQDFMVSASQFSIYELLYYFVIYSVAGWCLEVAYHVVTTGRFINRGFLNGPVCPIYGFGVVIVVLLLLPMKKNFFVLYIGSVLLTSLLELVTGFILKKAFQQRWWDYSNEPFNLNGYICLKFSLAWGIGGVLIVDVVHPMIYGLVKIIPHVIGVVVLSAVLMLFAVDAVITVITILKFNKRLKAMNEIAAKIRSLSDAMGEGIFDVTVQGMEKGKEAKEQLDEAKAQFDERRQAFDQKLDTKMENIQSARNDFEDDIRELHEKLINLKNTHQFGHSRLLKAFPQMKNDDFKKEIEELKKVVAERRKK